jgi:2-amino-4-hydroxy-6-hydroxymethyldihydropteridine diphosphokinase
VKTAYLALGSNLGDRSSALRSALNRLVAWGSLRIVRESSVYETAPVGVTAQPDFLNMAAQLATSLTADDLLSRCLQVEAELGRERRERWGPRTVDLDILWFEGETRQSERLVLPHPRMHQRGFVLLPLSEIAPDLYIDGRTVADWVRACDLSGIRKRGTLPPAAAPV